MRLTPGERRQLLRGGIAFLVISALLALLTGAPRFLSFGIALGAILTVLAAWAALWAFNAFKPRARRASDRDRDEERSAPKTSLINSAVLSASAYSK